MQHDATRSTRGPKTVSALLLCALLGLPLEAPAQDDTDLFADDAASEDLFAGEEDSALFGEDTDTAFPEDGEDDLFAEEEGAPATAAATADAEADGPSLGTKTFDLLVVRPLGATRIAVGAVLFLVSAPLAELPPFLGGDSERWRAGVSDIWQLFVMENVQATFQVPLGEFQEQF